jgi:hypothetical protein
MGLLAWSFHTHTHTHTHTHIYIYIYIYIYAHTYIYTHTYVCVQIYILRTNIFLSGFGCVGGMFRYITWTLSPRVKSPTPEIDQSLPCSAGVKNSGAISSIYIFAFVACTVVIVRVWDRK